MSWWAFYEKEYGKPVGRNMGYDKARTMAWHLFWSPKRPRNGPFEAFSSA